VDVVLDTNVLVSAMLSPEGPCAEVLGLVLDGTLTPVADDRVLGEYEEVLQRPSFGLSPTTVAELLSALRSAAQVVSPSTLRNALPDHADRCFLECALASESRMLVTGNKRHYPGADKFGVSVLSPRDLLARY